MKSIASTSAAMIVAMLGLGAMAPAALAQDQGPQAGPSGAAHQEQGFRAHNQDGPRLGGKRGGMRGGLLQFVCAERGAERLEHMFVAISYRIDLTAEQAPLFEALKTAALAAQTGFADDCAAVRPAARATAAMPNLVERLHTRVKLGEARIAALSGVLPSLEAFYSSLSDEQQAKLDVRPGKGREHFGKRQGPDRRPGQQGPMMDLNG